MTIETRPSGAAVWSNCSMAPTVSAMAPPEEPSDPAMEGTCAAWVAEMVLKGEYATCANMIGKAHPNGWVVEPEMARHVQGYVDMLKARGGTIDAERTVTLNDHIKGTPDSFAVFKDGHLFVDDLKYGYEIVEATSPQVKIYAGAITRLLERKGVRVSKITLGIYQPRAYHAGGIHRTITMWPEDLMMKHVHRIEAMAAEAHGPHARATPGIHCRRCAGAAYCAANAAANYENYQSMLLGEQRQPTAKELANELDFINRAESLLKGRKDAITAEAEARMKRGENIPGYVRESGWGNRRWKVNAATVQAMTGLDPTDTAKMVTPAEMERRGVLPEIIAALTEKPRTKATIKRMSENWIAQQFGE